MRMFLALMAAAVSSSMAAAEHTTTSAVGEVQTRFDAAEARTAVERYATLLEDMYVYPEIGTAYARLLRQKLEEGAYSSFASAEEFARALPRPLAEVNPDLHLNVLPGSVPSTGVISDASYAGGSCPAAGQQLSRSMGKSGWLAPGVAYLEFCGFQGGEQNLADLRDFLSSHRDAKTLIIDNRSNVGGAHQEMDVMFPHFYKLLTELLRFEMRSTVAGEDSNPLEAEPKFKRLTPAQTTQYAYYVEPNPRLTTDLREARIFVLTSRVTASAGEAATFALQRTGRATVVGETTKGAGHLGPTLPLGGGYRAFVPVARIFDAATGKGWEGTGVQPNVRVPAEQALLVALARAGANASAASRKWFDLSTKQPRNAARQ